MIGHLPDALDIHVVHRIHAGLDLDVRFTIDREIGIVFGPSGAGKTTLLRLIAGLARPDSGHVRLDGESLFDASNRIHRPLRRRRIGMIFQDDRLFPHLSVADNVRFGLKGWPRDQANARLAEVAELCGVEHLMGRSTESLSGGERQRVGLARALAPRPRLLLCDEPVSALDSDSRQAMVRRLKDVQRALAIPMLYVTHSVAEAVALGSRLFLMERGRIIASGPPLDVIASARRAGDGTIPIEGVLNVFPARVLDHPPGQPGSRIRLDDGPDLIVGALDRPPGSRLLVQVRADDILLARHPVEGLSARNQLAGVVERVVPRGPEAEAVIRTGGLAWIVSLVEPAVTQLGLAPGAAVHLIIKARSCHVLAAEVSGSPGTNPS
ncbi:MAG: molybdenum ABC transporter ATP-binding protein [Isosphaeraceae bacterium]